jgi:hypothetical protein
MAAVPTLQRPTAKDGTIMYGEGYALVTLLMFDNINIDIININIEFAINLSNSPSWQPFRPRSDQLLKMTP